MTTPVTTSRVASRILSVSCRAGEEPSDLAMTVLVSVETVLLVLLVVLVAGLLRSHAEILRRLGPEEGPAVAPPPARSRAPGELRPAAVAGPTPSGDVVTLAFDGAASRPTLLAFLTTGCSTCAGFWETLGER